MIANVTNVLGSGLFWFLWLVAGFVSTLAAIAVWRPTGETHNRGELFKAVLAPILGPIPLIAIIRSLMKNGRETAVSEDVTSDSELTQVIIIRRDLHMRRGKEIAQGGHAACAPLAQAITGAGPELNEKERAWITGSKGKKVVLQVPGKETLLEVARHCRNAGIRVEEIWDIGLTEFDGERTLTCISIGPDLVDKIAPFTRHLSLY